MAFWGEAVANVGRASNNDNKINFLIKLDKHYFTPMEEESSGYEVFPAGGGELVLDRDVLVAGKYTFEERLLFQISYELICGFVFR